MVQPAYTMRLVKDAFSPHAVSKHLPDACRVLYCNAGDLSLDGGAPLTQDDARFIRSGLSVHAGPLGGELWRWEIDRRDAEPQLELGEGIDSTIIVSNDVPGLDNLSDWLIRCDSVLFPTGGSAVPHTHAGPGIRCIRNGKLSLSTDTETHDYRPGDAWFEPGNKPVWADACSEGCTQFIRVLVLPKDLKGKSSIKYMNDADRQKPKSQRYKSYVDELLAVK